MTPLTPQLEAGLRELCRRFRVERLYLFGSATENRFAPQRSDFDFLVALENAPASEYSDNFLGLANALEQLLGRRVDLVTEDSIRNPYFKEAVMASRQIVYDARQQEASV